MILNIFILVLAVEIIAKRPPERPPDGGPIIKHRCQPGRKLWCSKEYPPPWSSKEYPPPPNPLIPPIKRDRGPPKDG